MTLNEFKDKYVGKQVEYHSYGAGALNQCVDLVNQYIVEVLGLTPIIGTNAKDFSTKYNKDHFEWIENTPTGVPQAGDIIVWNGNAGGGVGHVAVYLSGGVNAFQSLDQNWSQVERVTLEQHSYNNVSGWLRPIGKEANTMTIDNATFENLVTKATAYDNLLPEHDRVKHLLSENERVNKEKDAIIADLRHRLSQQEQETLEFVIRNEELVDERDEVIEMNTALSQKLEICETATDTPSTEVNPPTGNTAPSGGIIARLLRFLGL